MVNKQNWLTRNPKAWATEVTLGLALLLSFAFAIFQTGTLDANHWMAASREAVFVKHEYWRLWTSLFAHADLGHIISNSILFLPFSYLLTGYFSYWFFPVLGIFVGGLTNLIVLNGMPMQNTLVGISGVVHWMGAVWLTLFLLIDRRDTVRRRTSKVIIITVGLFAPQVYKPEISYLSHFWGYIFGIACAYIYYYFSKNKFLTAEVWVAVPDEEDTDRLVNQPP